MSTTRSAHPAPAAIAPWQAPAAGATESMPPRAAAAAAQAPAPAPALPGPDLAAQVGREVAGLLSSALERVAMLSATGRIDRASLRALRDEIERARRAGIVGQQLARLAGGQVAIRREALDLPALLRQALRQREPEIAARGLEVRQRLSPAPVRSDATLLYTLLQALLDWAFDHAAGRIELQIGHRAWPARPLLICRFAHTPADAVDSQALPLDGGPARPPDLDSLGWHLLQQAAGLLGVDSTREDDARATTLTLAFPDGSDRLALDGALPTPPGSNTAPPITKMAMTPATAARPLAGQQVLVLSARREICNSVREALRPLGVLLDFAATVAEARDYCQAGLPHAIVHDAGSSGDGFGAWRAQLRARQPQPVFIELAEQGRALEVHNVAGHQTCRVGRDAIFTSLPAALLFELTQPPGGDPGPALSVRTPGAGSHSRS